MTNDDQKARLTRFLAELTKLREEFGMEIGGCGDCGSAWVYDLQTNSFVGEEIKWAQGSWVFGQGSILDEE